MKIIKFIPDTTITLGTRPIVLVTNNYSIVKSFLPDCFIYNFVTGELVWEHSKGNQQYNTLRSFTNYKILVYIPINKRTVRKGRFINVNPILDL